MYLSEQQKEKKNKRNEESLRTYGQYQDDQYLAQKQTYGSMQQNREPSNKSTHQLIFDKESKNIQCRKESLFSKRCWES